MLPNLDGQIILDRLLDRGLPICSDLARKDRVWTTSLQYRNIRSIWCYFDPRNACIDPEASARADHGIEHVLHEIVTRFR